MTRPVPLLWATVAFLILLGVAVWLFDRPEACASSMTVEVGQAPVVNPVTCLP